MLLQLTLLKRLLYETILNSVDTWKNWNENFYGWLDSAQIFCGFDSRKTRLDLTETFYGSAFVSSAAAPSLPRTVRSLDRSFPGTFVPGTLDLSCCGPFIHLSAEQYLVQLQRRNSVCISLNFFVPLTFYFIRLDALALSIIATATWLAGWLSVTAGIVSKRLNVSENFFDHLIAPS